MEQLSPFLIRRTSTSSGLSYLSSGNIRDSPQRLYICFHGWACAATDYAPLLATLAAVHTSSLQCNLYIALDLPGHGSSPKSLCPHPTVPDFAGIANEIRRELSPDDKLLETIIVGHSMGCRMAIEALVEEHSNVSGLILIDGSWVGPNPEIHAAPVPEDLEKEIERITKRIGMYGPLTPESFKKEMQERLRRVDLDYEYELSRDYIEWDRERMEKALEEIGKTSKAKVLVIQSTQGRGGTRRPLKQGEEGPWLPFVREKVGNERFRSVVIEGCGHWPHIDKVEQVAQIISDFCVT